MRKKLFKQIFSFLLCVVLTISLVPGAVVAADTSGGNGSFVSETHDVFQHTESTLAPGVEQSPIMPTPKTVNRWYTMWPLRTSAGMMLWFRLPI